MGKRENFNQAMHEVFPFYRGGKSSNAEAETPSSSLAEAMEAKPVELSRPKANAPLDFNSSYDPREEQVIGTTYITKDTKITGTIQSRSNLDISGDVFGDVEGQNSVRYREGSKGTSAEKTWRSTTPSSRGTSTRPSGLTWQSERDLRGYFGRRAGLQQQAERNITVKRSIMIQKDSNITGDITGMTIDIEKGATIKSLVTVTGERKLGDRGRRADLIYITVFSPAGKEALFARGGFLFCTPDRFALYIHLLDAKGFIA
jgi:cytoskeletal protein CcmA (bactofilin family)